MLEEECIEVSIISNGLCFNYLHILKRFQPHLQLTFDGYNVDTHDKTRGKGNFISLVNGVKESRKRGFTGSIGLRINISVDNYLSINSILDMIKNEFESESGNLINTIYVALIHGNGTYDNKKIVTVDKYEYLSDRIEEWNRYQIEKESFVAAYEFLNPDIGCPYNGKDGTIDCGIRIDAFGDVFPCQLFSDKQFSLGNIAEDSLQKIITSKEMTRFIENVSSRRNREPCISCSYQMLCGSGCPARAFIDVSEVFTTSRCEERKQSVKSFLKEYLRVNNYAIY